MKLRQTVAFGVLAAFLTLSAAGRTDAQTKAVPAEQAVKDVAKGLSDGKPVVLWQALPASYQKDVKGLTADLAATMDADVFKKGVAVLQKSVKLLKDKKAFILANLADLNPEKDEKKVSDGYDGLVGILETLATSELTKLDDLKKADVEKFLTGTGAKLAKQGTALAKVIDPSKFVPGAPSSSEVSTDPLKTLKVTVVKAGPTETVLKLEMEGEKEPKEQTFVSVEGKWVPKEVQTEWAGKMEQAKKAIAAVKPPTPAEKQRLLAFMGNLDTALDKLGAAKSAEDFKKAAMEAVGGLMSGGAPPKQ